MPPSQLPDDMVSVVEEVADLDRVVTTLLVIPRSLLLIIVRPKDLLFLLVLLNRQSPSLIFCFYVGLVLKIQVHARNPVTKFLTLSFLFSVSSMGWRAHDDERRQAYDGAGEHKSL